MPMRYYFVAVFSETKSQVFKYVKDTWKIYNIGLDKKIHDVKKPGSFMTDVDFNDEFGITIWGDFGKENGKTKLELHNETSTDWIEVNKNSKRLMDFCLKFKPEYAYIFYEGLSSPRFVIYVKGKGVFVNISEIKLLTYTDENVKIVEKIYGARIKTYKDWEKLADSRLLIPLKKL